MGAWWRSRFLFGVGEEEPFENLLGAGVAHGASEVAVATADDQEAEVVVGAGSALLAVVAAWGRVELKVEQRIRHGCSLCERDVGWRR